MTTFEALRSKEAHVGVVGLGYVVILAGRRVNDAMGNYVAERTATLLGPARGSVERANVLVLGFAGVAGRSIHFQESLVQFMEGRQEGRREGRREGESPRAAEPTTSC